MKRIAMACVSAFCLSCSDPLLPPAPREGTITAISVVNDAFLQRADTTLVVDKDPADPAIACNETANVRIGVSTVVSWSDAPAVGVAHSALASGQKVRVLPPEGATDSCTPTIEATSIVIVK